ncbi:protoporphyrinogen/coproporphyrinogen oxidase [Candidatus Omnitrophota bacterium]
MTRRKKKVVILGAGLAGLSCAYFLKKKGIRVPVFEKDNEYGGLCRSFKKDGFRFDFCGHLLHFRTPQVFSLVKGLLGEGLIKHKRKAWVYALNRFIPYPFQTHFSHLPEDVAKECLYGFLAADGNGNRRKNGNFQNWIEAKFGAGIVRHFMVPYNAKFWKVPLRDLSSEWAERFIVSPSGEDVINGFLDNGNGLGYHAHFWYPRGGIGELTKGFAAGLDDIHLGCEAESVDLKKRKIRFTNGRRQDFDVLISTLPLPELAKLLRPVPKNIGRWFEKLRWISIYNINLGIEGRLQPGKHWIYFPERRFKFFRVGFYSNFSSQAAPSGKSALYIEVSYSKDNPIDKKRLLSRIVNDLRMANVLAGPGAIKTTLVNDIKYAYPLYDHSWSRARSKILDSLMSDNVFSVGRHGSWRYVSMEDVILGSKKAAQAAFAKL